MVEKMAEVLVRQRKVLPTGYDILLSYKTYELKDVIESVRDAWNNPRTKEIEIRLRR